VVLAKDHGASSTQIGLMFTIVGAGGLLGAIAAARLRRRLSTRAAVTVQSWLLAAVLPLLLVVHSALLIGLVVAAAEFLTPLTNSLMAAQRMALTPDRLRGRIQATVTALALSLGWLGPLAAGIGFEHAGQTATVLVLSAYAVVLAATVTRSPGLRRVPGYTHDAPRP
jgi:predicted MFS family arabinose efflux permease